MVVVMANRLAIDILVMVVANILVETTSMVTSMATELVNLLELKILVSIIAINHIGAMNRIEAIVVDLRLVGFIYSCFCSFM